jgi:hypothetical protein
MKAIYKARYLNALKRAARVNRYLKQGYIVLHDGQRLQGRFVLEGDDLCLRLSPSFLTVYFTKSPLFDHGWYTPIKKWNVEFDSAFEVYAPKAKVVFP